MSSKSHPDYYKFHASITRELCSLRDRVRSLVPHRLTNGEWRESILRVILRGYLPNSVFVGRGFVVGRQETSTQLDVLVLKPGSPKVFQDGDLVIVTPDAVGAVVEVKTRVGNSEWHDIAQKLAEVGVLCSSRNYGWLINEGENRSPWLGIFVYEGDVSQDEYILNALCRVYEETGVIINSVANGKNLFIRYWERGEWELGDSEEEGQIRKWRSYDLAVDLEGEQIGVSPSYFIGNLVDYICGIDTPYSSYAWFPYQQGKREFMRGEKELPDGSSNSACNG